MAERVVRNVDSDYLTCSICLSRFTDPRLLPCGHTFCCRCLAGHIKEKVSVISTDFSCPQDRVKVRPPNPSLPPQDWAESFSKDKFLNILLNAVVKHENGSARGQNINCDLHEDRTKEFFCVNCLQLVCAMCFANDHQERDCKIRTVDQAIKDFEPKIKSVERSIKNQIKMAEEMIKSEYLKFETLKDSKITEKRKIEDLEKQLKQFYQNARAELKKMKDTIQNHGNEAIQEHKEASRAILDKIYNSLDYFKMVCERRNDYEILEIISAFESQVSSFDESLRSLKYRQPSSEACFLRNPSADRAFKIIENLGSVRIQIKSQTEPTDDTLQTNRYVPLPPIFAKPTLR